MTADFKNVSIVGHYIKERTKDAQFVIISLRNNMFELADRLVGIYKTDNATKSVAINPGAYGSGREARQRALLQARAGASCPPCPPPVHRGVCGGGASMRASHGWRRQLRAGAAGTSGGRGVTGRVAAL